MEIFYREVVQAVIFFGAEKLVLSASMVQRLEGAYVDLLWKVTSKNEKRLRDRSCKQAMANTFLQGAGTQLLSTYLDKINATVVEWAALWPIFDVCAIETGYYGGGRLWVLWWKQAAADKHLKVTVEAIL